MPGVHGYGPAEPERSHRGLGEGDSGEDVHFLAEDKTGGPSHKAALGLDYEGIIVVVYPSERGWGGGGIKMRLGAGAYSERGAYATRHQNHTQHFHAPVRVATHCAVSSLSARAGAPPPIVLHFPRPPVK